MIVYRCWFEFCGAVRSTDVQTIFTGNELLGSLEDFRDGFWVDADLKFTRGADCRYWLPPTAIKYVERINRGDV